MKNCMNNKSDYKSLYSRRSDCKSDRTGETIKGPVVYCGGIVKAGYSVTEQKNYGNVIFHSGDIKIKARSVELHGGTSVELGTELDIEIQ